MRKDAQRNFLHALSGRRALRGIANWHAGTDGGTKAHVISNGAGKLNLLVEEEHARIHELAARAQRNLFVVTVDQHAVPHARRVGGQHLQ